MPAPYVAHAQGRIIGEIHGQTTVNVMHFATHDEIADEGELDTILLALATALLECTIETLLPAVSSDWRAVQCDAKRISDPTSDPVIATAPSDSVGELSASSVSFAASLVNLRTGGGGRQGRGRIFLPPAGEAATANSILDTDTMTLLTAFCACMAGKFLGTGHTTPWFLGVLSRKHMSGVGGTMDNSFREVTQLSPSSTVAILASRKKGHGV